MVNVAPLAPTLIEPDNNSYAIVSEPIAFSWTFNDPGDTQASGSLRYKVPAGAWTTLTDVVTTTSAYTMPAETLAADTSYEWQVQTKDSGGLWSLSWSASRFVNIIAALPEPTITAPASAAVVTASPVLVSWTIPDPFTQDAYVVYAGPQGFVTYNTGPVESSATRSVLVPLPYGTNNPAEFHVWYRYHGYWCDTAEVTVTNSILPPEIPLVVCAQVPDRPEVVISITNPPASDADHLNTVSVDLTRDGVRIAKDLPPNATFTDLLPGAGTIDYIATAFAASGGTAQSF